MSIDVINIIQPITVAIILALLGWFTRLVKKGFVVHEESHELLKKANLYQIKAHLLLMHDRASANNKISSHELEVWNNLFDIYTLLGGNSFMHSLYERVNHLDVYKDD